MANPEQLEAAIGRVIGTFGRLDIAFNNKAAPVHEIGLAESDRILDINLRGTFVCMKHELARTVRQGGGVIVNTSSGGGCVGCRVARPARPPSTLSSA